MTWRCRSAVEAGAETIAAIVAKGEPVYGVTTGFGKLAGVRIATVDLATLQRNLVLSHAAGVGEPLPGPVVRLTMALKLASLAQGASGVRWSTVDLLAACLRAGPCAGHPRPRLRGGVRRSRAPRPYDGGPDGRRRVPRRRRARCQRRKRWQRAGLEPLALGAKEGLALLNGTQVSTALALAGLFEAERIFQAALVTGALTTDAVRGSDGPFDPRIHELRRHRGQIEVAAALRALMRGSAIRASHLTGDDRVQDPYSVRCQPQVMGAVLDVLRQAAATLSLEANGVTDNPLVFARDNEVISGGNFHAEPVAFAADTMAMALCEIGSLAERRIAMLVDPSLSGLPAFLTPNPGLNSGFMIPQVTAAALVSENKQLAHPASVDSIPTSANQEDHVSMACHGARRLLAMARNTGHVIGIELLAAAQGCDFHAPLRSSEALERVRALLRERVPRLDDDRYLAPDMPSQRSSSRPAGSRETVRDVPLPACVTDRSLS